MTDISPVPLTIEGSSVLHQLFEFNWKAWRGAPDRHRILEEATAALRELEPGKQPDTIQSALYSVVGHKGDLMLVHFRDSVEDLNRIELALAQTAFQSFLTLKFSYLSIVELSLYESSRKTYASLAERGLEEHSPEWNAAIKEVLDRQKEAMAQRLFPSIPATKHLCFYPMDRLRSGNQNWYALPLDVRQRLMHDHGMIGRRYGNRVRQIISGSIGLDDWEWGVDLFADDPAVFKQLIYEMRFDEASSLYAAFGSFYVGVRLPIDQLEGWTEGRLP
ncbi:MAG: hydrogen peroxide-dependent heme synthase [Acidobacteriaceae bacterium]